MAFGRRSFVLGGLLTVACSPPLASAGHTRVASPAIGAAAEVKSAAVAPSSDENLGNGTASGTPRPLDLEEFRPLLARDELRAVSHAVFEEEYERAVDLLLAHLDKAELGGLEHLRHRYLLGILAKEAGKKEVARAAFAEAAQSPWILQVDARMHQVELDLELERYDSAEKVLEQLASHEQTPRLLGLRAAFLAARERYEEAAVAWGALVERAPTAQAHLQRARSLLAWAEESPQGSLRKERATEAAQAAFRARTGLPQEDPLAVEARQLEQRAAHAGAHYPTLPAVDDQMDHLRGLSDARKWEELYDAALQVKLPSGPEHLTARCELEYFKSKGLAGKREWGQAADRLRAPAQNCVDQGELHAWILFNAGKYSAADGRHTAAVAYYAELEQRYAENTLADDARLRAAKSYETMGAPARFVALLSAMPDDYPKGDMTMEGVLLLALHQMEKHDWSGAAAVLSRAAQLVRKEDSSRGHEYAGTERYFLARCQEQLGQEDQALAEYESIVEEVPLSYYMLHAYSRLLEVDSERAQAALARGLERAEQAPFQFPHRPEYATLEFRRGMELLRVGETARGQRALLDLGLGPEADDSLLWGIALLYDRAGDPHEAHGIARGRLTDWLSHYPEGDWQKPWEIGFPRPYHDVVEREAEATGVPEWFIYGVMREESTFLPRVVSHANAYGLMQIIPSTARGIGKKAGLPYSTSALKRPSINIAIGSRVLQELARRFRKNPWLAIPGYNAGPGRPASWLREHPHVDFDIWVEMIPFRETRRYTKRVLASRAAYAFLYYRKNAQTALVLPKRLNAL